MANRTVTVTLRAQAEGYVKAMEQAGRKTRELADDSVERLQKQREAFNTLGTAAAAAGATMAVGLGVAIAKFMEFDQAMSAVDAATHESAENMGLLREAALEAGAATVFTASEAAYAIEEMGKAGVSTADILAGGLNGALDLAAAGGLGVAEAAGYAATALKVFNLEGKDMSHVADLLAAGAGKAMGDVSDLGQAFSNVGTIASNTGLTIEETTGFLAAFASYGKIGADAGTAFKSMLQALQAPSTKAAGLMDELGISLYNSQGEFIGLAEFAGQYQQALSGMTQEQRDATNAIIFGSYGITAANALYVEGEEGIQEWISAVDDSGYAAETAARRLDNLAGDVEALGGAMDTALINMGSAIDGPARLLVQGLTDIVDGFNALPLPAQQTVFWIGAAATAATVAAGAYFLAIPKIAAYKTALETLGVTGSRTSKIMAGIGKGAGIAALGVGLVTVINSVTEAIKGAEASAADLQNSFLTGGALDVIDKAFQGTANAAFGAKVNLEDFKTSLSSMDNEWDLRGMGPFAVFENFIDWLDGGTDVSNDFRDSVQRIGDALATLPLDQAQQQLAKFAKEAELSDEQVLNLINGSGDYRDALISMATELNMAADDQTLLALALGEGEFAAEDNAEALVQIEGAANEAEVAVDDLSDTISDFGQVVLSVRSAERAFEQAIDEATAALNENGATLSRNTAQGLENEAKLDDIAEASIKLAAAKVTETGSIEDAAAALENGRAAYIEMAVKMGMNTDAAVALADSLGLSEDKVYDLVKGLDSVPEDTKAKVTVDTSDATRGLQEIIKVIGDIPVTKSVYINAITTGSYGDLNLPSRAYGGTIQKAAGGATIGYGGGVFGGTVMGMGTAKSDSILTALSNGEEVIQEPWASAYRPLLKAINSGGFSPASFGGGGTVINNHIYITAAAGRTTRQEADAFADLAG